MNIENTDYFLTMKYKDPQSLDDNEYYTILEIIDNNEIAGIFIRDFEIVTKLIAKLDPFNIQIDNGNDFSLELYIDGETEIKFEEELDLVILNANYEELSYSYDSIEQKFLLEETTMLKDNIS